MAAMASTATRAEVAVELREAVQAFTAAQRRLRGRDVFAAKRALLEERWQEALSDLSPDQLGQAAQVLRRMAEVLDGI